MFQQFFSDGSGMGLDEFLNAGRAAGSSIDTSQNPQDVTNAGHTIGRGSNDCFNADKDGIGVVAQGTTGFNSAQNVVVAFCAIGDGISFSIFLQQSRQISHQFQAFGHLLKVTFNFESEFS